MAAYHTFFKQQALQEFALHIPRPNPTFHNPPFAEAKFRVLIMRLSPFRDVERSTPHLFLAQEARRALPEAYIDMAFFPLPYDLARMEEAGVSLLTGIQSHHGVGGADIDHPPDMRHPFDVVLISNAYTLELVNLPYMLLHAGVPLLASQRDETWPLFIMGGSNAMAAQAVITEGGDSLVDALFFGEGEDQVGILLRCLYAQAHAPKAERLRRAAERVVGLWVAGEGAQTVEKAVLSQPRGAHLLVDYPLLNGEEAGTAKLQITYGCPAFCSFCFEGYDRKPYREVPYTEILEAACQLKAWGVETLELYSFNFNTHTDIFALLLRE